MPDAVKNARIESRELQRYDSLARDLRDNGIPEVEFDWATEPAKVVAEFIRVWHRDHCSVLPHVADVLPVLSDIGLSSQPPLVLAAAGKHIINLVVDNTPPKPRSSETPTTESKQISGLEDLLFFDKQQERREDEFHRITNRYMALLQFAKGFKDGMDLDQDEEEKRKWEALVAYGERVKNWCKH